jgi:hypothetical protein
MRMGYWVSLEMTQKTKDFLVHVAVVVNDVRGREGLEKFHEQRRVLSSHVYTMTMTSDICDLLGVFVSGPFRLVQLFCPCPYPADPIPSSTYYQTSGDRTSPRKNLSQILSNHHWVRNDWRRDWTMPHVVNRLLITYREREAREFESCPCFHRPATRVFAP